jgi:hypothetical protein
VRQVLIMLLVLLLFFVSFAVLGYLLSPMHDDGLWLGVMAMPLGGAINGYAFTQPRARRWLREHAFEIDRYLPV